MADTIGGITAAFAVAAALADRNRTEGVFIDVSMLEAAMATMGWAVSNHLIAGRDPMPLGNDNVTASPSGTFRTGDGLLNIAANKQEQFEAVCQVLGHPEWAQDPRFVDRHARLQHRDELQAPDGAGDGGASLPATGGDCSTRPACPPGPVYSVPQALAASADRTARHDRHVQERAGRRPRHPRRPHRLQAQRRGAARSTRRRRLLGQHSDEILAELGYSAAEIDALKAEKAV